MNKIWLFFILTIILIVATNIHCSEHERKKRQYGYVQYYPDDCYNIVYQPEYVPVIPC